MKKLLFIIFLTGCSKYSGPYQKCLESHIETYFTTQLIGKVVQTLPRTRRVCDKYSQQWYIKVDKKIYEVQYVYEE